MPEIDNNTPNVIIQEERLIVYINGGGGGGAPVDAAYVCVSGNTTLTNERILTGTTNQITITDGGADGNVTLSLPQSISQSDTPVFAGLGLTGFNGFVRAYSGFVSAVNIAAADIPSLDASKITTGQFADARIASATTWHAKEPTIVPGTTAQYWRGDKTWQTLASAINHNLLSSVHPDTLAATVVAGDLIYANSTPRWARLPKGTDGNILKMVSGYPAWAAESAGGGLWTDAGTYYRPNNRTDSGDTSLRIMNSASFRLGAIPTNTSANWTGLSGGVQLEACLGNSGASTTSRYPVICVEKWCGYNGGILIGDEGAGIFKTIKTTGASSLSGLISGLIRTGGTGDSVALHSRAYSTVPLGASGGSGSLFSIWAVATSAGSNSYGHLCCIEADCNPNSRQSGHYESRIGDLATAVWVVNQGIYHATAGYVVVADTAKWHTGLLITANSIVPNSGNMNEGILIQGGSSSGVGYSGIRMNGHINIGLDVYDAILNSSTAVYMNTNHQLRWPNDTYIVYNGTNMLIYVNGTLRSTL